MLELSDFCSSNFSVQDWVNQACNKKPSDEPLDRFISELEMQLQLTAEEVEVSLQDSGAQVLRRVPFAVQEVSRLQSDVEILHQAVAQLSQEAHRDRDEALASVSVIVELDRVVKHMESACRTLKEATELSGLFVRVDQAFTSGDLPLVAELLSSMKKSLSVVGDVPEFREGKAKLRALEDRLQSRVEGGLEEALRSNNSAAFEKLALVLLAVDRYTTVEKLYCSSRLQTLMALWNDLEASGDISAWLPSFYSGALELLRNEAQWCQAHLAAHADKLISSLMRQTFIEVNPMCRSKLAEAQSLPVLQSLQQAALDFVDGLRELVGNSRREEWLEVTRRVFEPLEEQVSSYGDIESAQLRGEISRLALTLSPSRVGSSQQYEDLDGYTSQWHGRIKMVFELLSDSLSHCLTFTGGTELPSLFILVDSTLHHYLGEVQGELVAFKKNVTDKVAGGSAMDDLPAVLKVLLLNIDLNYRVASLEALLRGALGTHISKMEAAAQQELAPDRPLALLPLRLKVFPQKLEKLRSLAAQRRESRFLTLREATKKLDQLGATMQEVVYEAMLAPVKQHLEGLVTMKEWQQLPPEPVPGKPVVSFSTYPLATITAVGEYLMSLPEYLEVLMNEGGATGGWKGQKEEANEALAREWLDKLVSGAAKMYVDEVLKVPEVSPLGANQLATDADYLCNAVAALQVTVPLPLATLQPFMMLPSEDFMTMASAALTDNTADMRTLKTVATMRNIPWTNEGATAAGPSVPPAGGV